MRCALCGDRTVGIPLHRFPNPAKFPEQFKAWVTVLRRLANPDNYFMYKHQRICARHFRVEDRNRRNRLNKQAVPSLHLPMWCDKPGIQTGSLILQSNVDSTIEQGEISNQIVSDSASSLMVKEKFISLEHNYASKSGSAQMSGVILGVEQPTLLTTGSCIRDEHNYCSKKAVSVQRGSRASCEISNQIVSDSTSSHMVEEKFISIEHNYASKSGSAQMSGVILGAEQPTFLITGSCVRDEHNYCSKKAVSVQRGSRASRNTMPSHLLTKLKTSMRQVKNLKREIIRLRKRGLGFKTRLENAEKLSENLAFQTITKRMTKPAKLLTMMQFRDSSKKPKGRRFTTEEKILALSIFKKSPKCYSLLAKQFTLPSKKTLKSVLSMVVLKAGINQIVFEKIKKTVAAMNTDAKLCSVIFDEMSISPQINYNASKDELKGLTTNGRKIADHVLVFMVKGIKANYKQPVAYYFTNSLNKFELKATLVEVIQNIEATGLRVMCTVCDQSTVNVGTINNLVEDTKSEYMRRGREFRFPHFKINRHAIIPLYDIPHIIMGIRNNLLNKHLVYIDDQKKERIVKWEYFEKIYGADKSYGELRLAHKLTEEHINKEKIKKMKVKTAAQVFSQSVAAAAEHLSARGDLPLECRDLIPLVLMLDKLFDSLNGNTFNIPCGKIYKGSVKRNSPHHELWRNAIKTLKTIKFKSIRDGQGKVRCIESTVPSVVNFIWTIEGVQNLWKILVEKYSFDTLLTRNLNQDPVENFFGNIRCYGARNVAPNTVAFEGAYKSLLLNNYNAPHSLQANCEEDKNDCLQSLDFFLTENHSPSNPEPTISYSFNKDILNSVIPEDKGQRNYVCGWVLTKCYKNIIKSCKICRRDLNTKEKIDVPSFTTAKEYDKKKKSLCYINKDVERIFGEIQAITCTFLKKDVPKYGLKATIVMLSETLINFPFKCQEHKLKLQAYFVDTTVKVLIYSWCRSINRILSGKLTHDLSNDDDLKHAAHVYYSKHKNNKNQK